MDREYNGLSITINFQDKQGFRSRLMVGILYNLALSHMSPILEVMQYRKMHLKQW